MRHLKELLIVFTLSARAHKSSLTPSFASSHHRVWNLPLLLSPNTICTLRRWHEHGHGVELSMLQRLLSSSPHIPHLMLKWGKIFTIHISSSSPPYCLAAPLPSNFDQSYRAMWTCTSTRIRRNGFWFQRRPCDGRRLWESTTSNLAYATPTRAAAGTSPSQPRSPIGFTSTHECLHYRTNRNS
jgi:hypothetical protein